MLNNKVKDMYEKRSVAKLIVNFALAIWLILGSGILMLEELKEEAKKGGTITGEVYLKEGGISLAGEKIKIYRDSNVYKTVTTGRNGHYKITLPRGQYTVLLKDEGYSIDFKQRVSLKAGNTVHCKDIVGEKNA